MIIVVYLVPLGAYRHAFVLEGLMLTTELQLFILRYFLYMVAINIPLTAEEIIVSCVILAVSAGRVYNLAASASLYAAPLTQLQ